MAPLLINNIIELNGTHCTAKGVFIQLRKQPCMAHGDAHSGGKHCTTEGAYLGEKGAWPRVVAIQLCVQRDLQILAQDGPGQLKMPTACIYHSAAVCAMPMPAA